MEVNVTLIKPALRPRPRAMRSAISTSKPTTLSGWAGSASTNGAPPSGSPAQRNSSPLRRRGADGQRYQCREGSERGDFDQGSHMILPKNS